MELSIWDILKKKVGLFISDVGIIRKIHISCSKPCVAVSASNQDQTRGNHFQFSPYLWPCWFPYGGVCASYDLYPSPYPCFGASFAFSSLWTSLSHPGETRTID